VERIATVREHSAGGVLWRPSSDGGAEICLIATKGGTRWQLPKGHKSGEETEAEAARREVREETGCDGRVDEDLGEISFWFVIGPKGSRRRVKKSVRFFLLSYLGGETRDHDAEVDDARWFPADKARTMLTFDSERQIVDLALQKIRAR
jgi:8-oxo-dGTP pyrophosphatase MutT (NUDIX family)